MTLNSHDIVVIIPCKNESTTIYEIVDGLVRCGCDVIVVNDRSIDDTAKLARLAGAKVVDTTEQTGYEASISEGITAALRDKWKYEVLVVADGDGEHSLESIIEVGRLALSSRTLVLGYRPRSSIPRLAEHLANVFLSRAIPSDCTPYDWLCGCRAFPASFLKSCLISKDLCSMKDNPLYLAPVVTWLCSGQVFCQVRVVGKPRLGQSRYGSLIKSTFKLTVAVYRLMRIIAREIR